MVSHPHIPTIPIAMPASSALTALRAMGKKLPRKEPRRRQGKPGEKRWETARKGEEVATC